MITIFFNNFRSVTIVIKMYVNLIIVNKYLNDIYTFQILMIIIKYLSMIYNFLNLEYFKQI